MRLAVRGNHAVCENYRCGPAQQRWAARRESFAIAPLALRVRGFLLLDQKQVEGVRRQLSDAINHAEAIAFALNKVDHDGFVTEHRWPHVIDATRPSDENREVEGRLLTRVKGW